MSRRLPNGLPVEQTDLPADRDEFLATIFREWAVDEHKVRRLAAAQLNAIGWPLEMVAAALGIQNKGTVSRMVDQLHGEFREAFTPPLSV